MPHRSLLLTPFLLLAACKGPDLDADPAWALNWASVTPSAEGIEGYQVWEFFVDGWEKKHEAEYFKCSIVQDLTGDPIDDPEGCPICEGAWSLSLTMADLGADDASDCPAGIQSDPSYTGPATMAVGAVPEDLSADAPYPSLTLGWFIGFDQSMVEVHGYAYPEVLESGGTPAGIGWVEGETYIFWPAYVWEL